LSAIIEPFVGVITLKIARCPAPKQPKPSNV